MSEPDYSAVTFGLHRMPFHCVYDPKPDITAYELALIVSFMGRPIYKEDWEKLGTANRHLVPVKT